MRILRRLASNALPRMTPADATVMHPSLVPRINPFMRPALAWLRDFRTFEPVSMVTAAARVFKRPVRVDILHRIVHWHRASIRAGTASTKHRSDVSGSTRKLYQQKGLGKARAGSIRAPQRRGGARCFGPKPHDFYYPLAPKVRSLGLCSALSAKFKQGQLSFVETGSIALETQKTAGMAQILAKIPGKKVLLLDTQPPPRNLFLAARSLQERIVFMNVCADAVNAYHILNNSFVLLTERAKIHYERLFEALPY